MNRVTRNRSTRAQRAETTHDLSLWHLFRLGHFKWLPLSLLSAFAWMSEARERMCAMEREEVVAEEEWKIRTKFFHFMEQQLKCIPNSRWTLSVTLRKCARKKKFEFKTTFEEKTVGISSERQNRKTNTIHRFAYTHTRAHRPSQQTSMDSERWKSETDWFKYAP